MAILTNFTATIKEGNILELKDTSILDATVITNRYWFITDIDGNRIEIPFPIVDGETYDYTLDKDIAVVIQVVYNYSTVTGAIGYSKIKNVLACPKLSGIIYDLRKKFLDVLLNKDRIDEVKPLIEDIEMLDNFYEAATRLISTDVKSAQLAIDMGNDMANKYMCNV